MSDNRFTIRQATPEQAAGVDAAIEELRLALCERGVLSPTVEERPPHLRKELEQFLREPKAITAALRAKAEHTARLNG